MTKKHIIAAAMLLFSAIFVWKSWSWNLDSDNRLKRTLNQYGETRSLIVKHERLRSLETSVNASAGNDSLFSSANEAGMELLLVDCIESLRPGTSQDGKTEILDIQMRGLYLGEAMRWLQAMESIPGADMDSLSLRRTDMQLLDMDMRLVRQKPKQ